MGAASTCWIPNAMRSASSRRRAKAPAPAVMRQSNQRGLRRLAATGLALLLTVAGVFGKAPAKEPEPAVLVVLDPLAKELACACVKGFGQRDYRKLAAKLETTLKQPVSIEFSDDLEETLG